MLAAVIKRLAAREVGNFNTNYDVYGRDACGHLEQIVCLRYFDHAPLTLIDEVFRDNLVPRK